MLLHGLLHSLMLGLLLGLLAMYVLAEGVPRDPGYPRPRRLGWLFDEFVKLAVRRIRQAREA